MKKFLIWCGGIFVFLGLLVVLNFTLFTLNTVSIKFHNATVLFADTSIQNNIIETGEFKSKDSVIFMDKQSHIDKIEKQYPFLKVVNIEINFPNNITIHCIEREPVFAVKTPTNILICDKDFKVLEIEETTDFESTQNNCILIEGLNIETLLTAGDFIITEQTPLLKLISPAFELNNRNIYEQQSLIKKIEITTMTSIINSANTPAIFITDFNGLETQIEDALEKLEAKINIFLALQSQILNINEKFLLIYESLARQIVAREVSLT
ncbi:MAG: hypothetical protein PHQ62_00155 [Clostridia bacterium]|nr:hypothetical protein [Clostridia bacterium]